MPVQLPKARTFNQYAVVGATDFYNPDQPWLRVMFFQGSFTITQARNFFRAYKGHGDQFVNNPPLYFTEPVEILMVIIPPEEHMPKIDQTANVFQHVPTNCYCSAYDWGVAQNIIASHYPDQPMHMCNVGHLWWQESPLFSRPIS